MMRFEKRRWVFGLLVVVGVAVGACDSSQAGPPPTETDIEVPKVEAEGMEARQPALLLEVDRDEIRLSRQPMVGRWQEASDGQLREELEQNGLSIDPAPAQKVVDLAAGRVDASQKRGGEDGFEIVPVLEQLIEETEKAKRIAELLELKWEPRVGLAVDADVPVATVIELLYTTSQAGLSDHELWGEGEDGEGGAVRPAGPDLSIPTGLRGREEPTEKTETCVRPTAAVGPERVVVSVGADSQCAGGDDTQGSCGDNRPDLPPEMQPTWHGKVLTESSGTCATVDGVGPAQMKKLRDQLDGIEFAPLCRDASLVVTDDSIGYGRYLRLFAGMEAHGGLDVSYSIRNNESESEADCGSTTDGRLAGDWSDKELQWLYDRSAENFQQLMDHLEGNGPVGAEKKKELEGELADWPDRLRVLSAGWIDRLGEGGEPGVAEFARGFSASGDKLGVEGVGELLDREAFGQIIREEHISHLDLSDNQIGSEGAKLLAGSALMKEITTLDLSDNDIGPEGFRAVAQSDHLKGLERLVMSRNEVGEAAAGILDEAPHLSCEIVVGLSEHCSDEGIPSAGGGSVHDVLSEGVGE